MSRLTLKEDHMGYLHLEGVRVHPHKRMNILVPYTSEDHDTKLYTLDWSSKEDLFYCPKRRAVLDASFDVKMKRVKLKSVTKIAHIYS